MTRIHLARPGRYRDMHDRSIDLPASRIAALAAAYNAGGHKAPLVLGHPKHDDPAYGWVASLEVDDKGDLYGVVDQVAPELSEAVSKGAYRNVSISWWPKGHDNNPAKANDTLRHVGILGAQAPAIAGLTPLSLSEGDGACVIELGAPEWAAWSSIKQLMRGWRDWLIESQGMEAADRLAPSYLVDDLGRVANDAKDDASPAFASPEPKSPSKPAEVKEPDMPDEPTVDLAARTTALEAREAALAAREAELDAAQDAARKSSAVAFCDALIAEGRLAPAAKDVIALVHERLSGEAEPIAFADGSSKPALAAFEELLKGAKPIINLSEVSADDPSTRDRETGDPVALADRAAAIRKDRPSLTNAQAIREAEKEMGA